MECGPLGRHLFCDDFTSSTLPGRFETANTASGTLTLDPTTSASTPQSLLAKTLLGGGPSRTLARLRKTTTAKGSRFTFGFAESIDPSCVGATDLVQTGGLVFGATYFLSVGHGPDHDSLVETSLTGGIYVQSHALRTPLPRGKWARVTLDVDFTTGTVGLGVDGVSVMAGEPLKYMPANAQQQVAALEIGTLTDNVWNKPSACTTRFDDVTFDALP
jgi:hypothetical protein